MTFLGRKEKPTGIKMPLKDLQKHLKDKQKKVVFGAERNIMLIKQGKISEVFLASNCSSSVKNRLSVYPSFSSLKIDELPSTSSELAIICEENFPISIAGVLK